MNEDSFDNCLPYRDHPDWPEKSEFVILNELKFTVVADENLLKRISADLATSASGLFSSLVSKYRVSKFDNHHSEVLVTKRPLVKAARDSGGAAAAALGASLTGSSGPLANDASAARQPHGCDELEHSHGV